MLEYKDVPFSFRKQGIYYFVRRVPKDLQGYYLTRKISYSLRTKSARVARSRSALAAAKLDGYWYQVRLGQASGSSQHLIPQGMVVNGSSPANALQPQLSVQKAISIYLKLKGEGKSKTSLRAVERSMGYLTKACGNKFLDQYSKSDATNFRDALIERGLTGSSIARTFGTVKSVFNLATNESGFDIRNPFSGVYFDRQAGVVERMPIPIEEIQRVQLECKTIDDDIRWLVALISDTGMRLSEAVGLHVDDIVLKKNQIPFVRVKEHPWRRLKTKDSTRVIPLVGASLWAANRLQQSSSYSKFSFPRYNLTGSSNANSASAALNKWLKPLVSEGRTLHSFRHSMELCPKVGDAVIRRHVFPA